MAVRDPFSYTARFDSVGLDCAFCKHFNGPQKWPDTDKLSSCKKHGLTLTIELAANGYKEGEWFCRDFANNGRAFTKAVAELIPVQKELNPQILYRAHGKDGLLQEYPFEEVRRLG
ncbi:MAG: hypothetical protein V4607_14140 [Pseudomonadota bacterium]